MKAIDVHYPAGHTLVEKWEKTEYFCMRCGWRAVWTERASDYVFLCAACSCTWETRSDPIPGTADVDHQRWLALANEPAIDPKKAEPL